VGGSLWTSGRFRHRCREKDFRPPLARLRVYRSKNRVCPSSGCIVPCLCCVPTFVFGQHTEWPWRCLRDIIISEMEMGVCVPRVVFRCFSLHPTMGWPLALLLLCLVTAGHATWQTEKGRGNLELEVASLRARPNPHPGHCKPFPDCAATNTSFCVPWPSCACEMHCGETGCAAAKGLQPRAAARHMVTTKPGRYGCGYFPRT